MFSKSAILIHVYQHKARYTDTLLVINESLDELSTLTASLNIQVHKRYIYKTRTIHPLYLLTKGLLEDFKQNIVEDEVDLVIFDNILTSNQINNLGKTLSVEITDRASIIIQVFKKHASSREAKIQTELAQLSLDKTRVVQTNTHHLDQQGGGLYMRGGGEKKTEQLQRSIREKERSLKKELASIEKQWKQQTQKRSSSKLPSFALLGYTSSGKSSLATSLTKKKFLADKKIFSTLDTMVKSTVLNNGEKILIIDTVGFIRNLPHILISAFKSTLQEATSAKYLLVVIDIAHPYYLEKLQTVLSTIKNIKAPDPHLCIATKIDLIDQSTLMERLVNISKFISAPVIPVSNYEKIGIDNLKKHLEMILLEDHST